MVCCIIVCYSMVYYIKAASRTRISGWRLFGSSALGMATGVQRRSRILLAERGSRSRWSSGEQKIVVL